MTSLIQDMIQSILSLFASQLKANSASKGDYSQDQAQEISGDPGQGLEQDQVDQVDPPEEEGERWPLRTMRTPSYNRGILIYLG